MSKAISASILSLRERRQARQGKRHGERGFTLVEMLVVITIIGLIMGLIGPRVLNYLGESKVKAAKIQLQSFSSALDLFNLDAGRYPSSAEGLAALVREQMGADPFGGTVFVFRAKRSDRIKLIFWDGTGMCLFAKRLEEGEFRWPKVEDAVMRLTAAQLSALLEGLDWRRVHEMRHTRVPAEAG